MLKKSLLSKIAVVCLLFVGKLSCESGHTQPALQRIEVHARRFAFTPNEITVKKGEPVLLILTSEDATHGLRFRELNIDMHVEKGKSAQVEFTPEMTGDFIGHCSVFCGAGHGSMTLTLHVVD